MIPPEGEQNWVWLARIRRPQGRKGEVFADILTDFPEKFAERRRLWLIADPDSPRAKAHPAPGKGTGFSPHVPPTQRKGALEVTEKGAYLDRLPEGHIAGAEAHVDFATLAARLKSCPDTEPSRIHTEANLSAVCFTLEGSPREVELQTHWLHKGGIVLHFAQSGSISDAETLAGLIVAIPLEQRAPLDADEVYIADLIGCTLVDVAGVAPVSVGEIEDVDRSAGPVALLVVRSAESEDEVLVPFAKNYLRRIDLAAKRVEMALPEGLLKLNAPGSS